MDILHLHLHFTDFASNLSHFSHHGTTILAQTFDDVDILADMTDAWYNFVDTGQCWALGIGVIVGYGFKSMTGF